MRISEKFEFVVLILGLFAVSTGIAQTSTKRITTEREVLPIAPQSTDGFDGEVQSSFAATQSEAFSSQLLKKKKNKKTVPKKGKAKKQSKRRAPKKKTRIAKKVRKKIKKVTKKTPRKKQRRKPASK